MSDHGARRVLVLVQTRVNLLDLAGPVQVLSTATAMGADYALHYVATDERIASAQGLQLAGLAPLPTVSAGQLVLVPGPRLDTAPRGEPLVEPAVVEWLRSAADAGARVAAVCTGAAALGEAGLLDGRRCTTHWGLLDAMRRRYPRALVQDDVLFVHDGPVSTSAGISAGIDLALSLVERDEGAELAAAVARQLVVYLRRDAGTGQISPFLRYRTHSSAAVHRVQDHLAAHLDARPTLAELAALVGLSPRALSRAFTSATGVTPWQFHRTLRVERAATLLADTDLTVEAVAQRCGLRDARHLRRLYRAHTGHPPSQGRAPAPSRVPPAGAR